MRFSFLHAADLHLDSPFQSVNAEHTATAEALRQATMRAFDELVKTALEARVAFVIIAGDVFDGRDKSLRAQLHFRDGLARLAEADIAVYSVHGNHDPASSWLGKIEWPGNVRFFSSAEPETVVHEIDGVAAATVTGMSYAAEAETRDLAASYPAAEASLFSIAVLHSNCGGNPGHANYAPCRLEQLRASGYDYWALGHVHERVVVNEQPWVVYPGNTQGRSIRECGARGCYLVEVDEAKRVTLIFKELDTVRWQRVSVAIDGLATLDALDDALAEAITELSQAGRACVCRVAIGGRGELAHELRDDALRQEMVTRLREQGSALQPWVWVDKVSVSAKGTVDLAARAELDDLTGLALSLIQRRLAELADKDGEQREALAKQWQEELLGELWNNSQFARELDALDAAALREILDDAQQLCWDVLEGESA